VVDVQAGLLHAHTRMLSLQRYHMRREPAKDRKPTTLVIRDYDVGKTLLSRFCSFSVSIPALYFDLLGGPNRVDDSRYNPSRSPWPIIKVASFQPKHRWSPANVRWPQESARNIHGLFVVCGASTNLLCYH